MRRMIDPKEIGGGGEGGEGVYMYAVKITGNSYNPATLIFNVITNHTGLLTKEAVGRSEVFNKEKDLMAFFSKFKEIWPSYDTIGPYIIATGTFGTGSDIKDIHYVRYNKLADVIKACKDESDENYVNLGGGNTTEVFVQRIM